MHVDELLGCNDRHASSIVSEVKAPEGGSCLHGCLEYTGSSSALAYRSVEGQGGKKAVMTDLVLGYFKDPKQSPLPTSSSCVQLMACCCRGSRAVVAKAGKG